MITLPHRCEFFSDAWLDEARKFLERECNRKERLGGRAFSVSERFTDAPPHLKFADNVGSWGMRYDGENVRSRVNLMTGQISSSRATTRPL